MDLAFNQKLAEHYRSVSQKIRVLSEDWVSRQGYCPSCATSPLQAFGNNQPVADFYCPNCQEQFELKSKKAQLSQIINDGAYATMIERINNANNPNFFFLTYSAKLSVNNFLIIPKYFFTPSIIVKRPPLAPTARRAGWVGCNIDLRQIPESGKVFLVKNQHIIRPEQVTERFQKTLFLAKQPIESRGWLLDMMQCVEQLPESFTLTDAYKFEAVLKARHPNNNNIKAKIRQQLQVLRDQGIIEFVARGRYRKIQ